jgi:hypothetical protein
MVLVADFSPVPLVFVTGLCTWALFGILEIGLLIEDPFQRILRTSWTGVIAESVMYGGREGGRAGREGGREGVCIGALFGILEGRAGGRGDSVHIP